MADLQDDKSDQTFRLLLSLLGTIQSVVKLNSKQQRIFREVDTFVQVVCIINSFYFIIILLTLGVGEFVEQRDKEGEAEGVGQCSVNHDCSPHFRKQ